MCAVRTNVATSVDEFHAFVSGLVVVVSGEVTLTRTRLLRQYADSCGGVCVW